MSSLARHAQEREDEGLAIEIRHFTWPDVEAIARLHRASEPVDHAGRLGDAIALQQRWRRPGNRPEEECLVATVQGAVIGYCHRSLVPGTDQCLVDGVVHPAWRRHGIGRSLLARISDDARLAGARTLDVRARDDEPATMAFCQALGFHLARVWHRMWLEPLRLAPFAFPAGYSPRPFHPRGDVRAYVEIVNDTQAGHWGIGPIDLTSVASLVSQPGFDPGNILFASHEGAIVGVSAVRYLEREVGSRTFAVGHIGPVGVRVAHRGLGLGHALLAATLRQCRRRQMQAAELDVDEANAPAIHVYEDCGFETLFRILWYRRDLTAAAGQSGEPA